LRISRFFNIASLFGVAVLSFGSLAFGSAVIFFAGLITADWLAERDFFAFWGAFVRGGVFFALSLADFFCGCGFFLNGVAFFAISTSLCFISDQLSGC
jgi:hypothetical protein